MAYNNTAVPVSRSQEAIRKLIMTHDGFGVSFQSLSDPLGNAPATEGFLAKVMIQGQPYNIKVLAKVKNLGFQKRGATNAIGKKIDQEERRVWRVLYFHMKSVFEAADSGVMELRELMLPYIVTGNGMSIAERLLPMMATIVTSSQPMLTEGGGM